MKKNICNVVAMALSAVSLLALLSGCGSTPSADNPSPAPASSSSDPANSGEDKAVDYPTKNINLTVPYDAGSATDIRARILAQAISDKLGQTVTVTNLPGAAGTVGATDFFMKSADPHEILVVGVAAMTTAPLTNPSLPYVFEDFKVVGAMDQEEQILYVCPGQSGINSFEDLVAAGQSRTVKYGGGGPTAANDIIQAATYKLAGMKYESIVSNSTSQRITDVLGGSSDVTVAPPASGAEFVKSGELLPIAVLSEEDYTGFDGITVPSLNSLGYDFLFNAYNMILVKGDVDDAYISLLYDTLQEIYASEDYQQKAADMGMNICTDDPEAVKATIDKTIEGFKEMLEIIG